MIKVAISNGEFKFILGAAAFEAERNNFLAIFITAGYPTKLAKFLIGLFGLQKYSTVQRLLNREEFVSSALIRSIWSVEIYRYLMRFILIGYSAQKKQDWLLASSLALYANSAGKILLKNRTINIYHYRSGYGQSSLDVARNFGAKLLCDHSIAHPDFIDYLVENEGRLPESCKELPPKSKFWRKILRDLQAADHIIVNSDFVYKTFLHAGFNSERLDVVYVGIDNSFLNLASEFKTQDKSGPIRFLFAGELSRRKGVHVLLEALSGLNSLDWSLDLAGAINDDVKLDVEKALLDNRIRYIGYLSMAQLASRMSFSDVFIFPSLAEGSARVIFMAMACGCYIITTPNSGSIVSHEDNGLIVNPGDVNSLRMAVYRALNMGRDALSEVGRMNSELVGSCYTQKHYGKRLRSIYEKITNH